ncbi:recombinase family protein [Streptomyces sp. NPDC053253]|uniref:recombinase family protein n=1 Tax=Streptomyces sp. NPDC053253 TaxID=3365699 RepID=UPI0037D83A77
MAKKTAEEFRDGSPEELVGKSPEDLVDLYLRRSKKRETVETLKQHARDLRCEMDRQGLTVRKVWLEQRSASKQHVRREKLEGAMAAVMAGEIKTLAVWKTDRFDRRGMAAIGTALDEFDRRQARLYVSRNAWTPASRAPVSFSRSWPNALARRSRTSPSG